MDSAPLPAALARIRSELASISKVRREAVTFEAGEYLLGEGQVNELVGIQLEVAQLTRELHTEKQELKNTIAELQATRNRLIQRDTGPGISDSVRDKIFQSHFSTKHGAHYGLGLGLAIARGIIEKHGGFIEVGNCIPRGAQFTVFLREAGASTTDAQ